MGANGIAIHMACGSTSAIRSTAVGNNNGLTSFGAGEDEGSFMLLATMSVR